MTIWDFIRGLIRDYPKLVLFIVGVVVLLFSSVFLLSFFNTKPGDMVTMLGLELFPRPETRKGRDARNNLPVISENTIEEIREINGVRALEPLQNGLDISRLPHGIFGFVTPWGVKSPGLTLYRRKINTYQLEIHKSSGSGQIYVVGYVSPESLLSLQDQLRDSPAKVILFLVPFDGMVPAAIPYSRVIGSANRWISGDEGQGSYYIIDMSIR